MLRDHGHETVHLRDERLERLPDSAIMEKARREGRIVVTFDLDFGDLLMSSSRPDPPASESFPEPPSSTSLPWPPKSRSSPESPSHCELVTRLTSGAFPLAYRGVTTRRLTARSDHGTMTMVF